jgi:putative spermidine/putrescine transport system ATP-binding protein
VYVTHDQEEALALSDRIAVFRNGAIEQIGSPSDLYERPRSRFVAEFMGESNVLPGRSGPDNGDDSLFYAEGLSNPVRVASAGREDCCLVLRPQTISVLVAGSNAQADNRVAGIVEDVSYLGATRRVIVDCAGTRFLVREATHAGPPVSVGDPVEIGWHADDAMLVPEA